MLMIQNRSIICVIVLILVQLTAKIDWNMGHFLDKINFQLQFSFVSFLYVAVLVLMHQHLNLVYHYGVVGSNRIKI